MLLEEYVATLPDEEKILIIEGHETLKEAGAIGDEPIRQHATAFIQQHDIPDARIIMWMEMLAFECHRYFSELYRKTL